MDKQTGLATLHYHIIQDLIVTGRCPKNDELASRLRVSGMELVSDLKNLAAMHGLVLHPDRPEPWVVHPFSLTPTLNLVKAPQRCWWAPCIWCAFGIAALVKGEVRIHTRYGGEEESVKITVRDGRPEGFETVVVHFAIPPAKAWNNVHEHCSLVLPFPAAEAVRPWCERHGAPYGEAVPLSRVAELACRWYEHHADPNWHKWTVEEAQAIFNQTGLRSSFWNLGPNSGRY